MKPLKSELTRELYRLSNEYHDREKRTDVELLAAQHYGVQKGLQIALDFLNGIRTIKIESEINN